MKMKGVMRMTGMLLLLLMMTVATCHTNPYSIDFEMNAKSDHT
jgi:hypothetical protein